MTKADLIAAIAGKLKCPWARAELLVDQIFVSMVDTLKRGEGIEIRGFGSFTVRQYKAYEGRNPRTGEAVNVKPKRLAFFKVGKELRERVNAAAPKAGGAGRSSAAGAAAATRHAGPGHAPGHADRQGASATLAAADPALAKSGS
jgi:integration host factor subunit beta